VHELLYPLMQGYDSVAMKADVELGGHRSEINPGWSAASLRRISARSACIITMPLSRAPNGGEDVEVARHYSASRAARGRCSAKLMSISDPLMWRYIDLLSSSPPRRSGS